jgi:hypothetical protein
LTPSSIDNQLFLTFEAMDWSKIEKNVQFHTSARLQQPTRPSSSSHFHPQRMTHSSNPSGALINYDNQDGYDRGLHFYKHNASSDRGRGEEKAGGPTDNNLPANSSTAYDDEFEPAISSSGIANHAMMCNDIDEIKSIIMKQNEKIKALELAADKRDVVLSVSSKQDLIQDRIDRVEIDLQSCSKYIQNISQESSDLGLQAKACSGRLTFVEEMYRSSAQEYVTKTTFSQLLTSCMDQLKDINTISESARVNGLQSMQFVESFLGAISNLQSGQPSLSLEFLIGLSG